MLQRNNRWRAVMEAVGANRIAPADLDSTQVNLLRSSPDAVVSERAVKIFGPLPATQPGLLEKLKPVLKLRGNSSRGRELFLNACAGCHQPHTVVQSFGPDLETLRSRSREALLNKIVAPGADITPGYETTVLQTVQGETIAGIITDPNPNTITIRQPQGSAVWSRTAIQRLDLQPWSLMPDNIVLQFNAQSLADLMDYLAVDGAGAAR
jgi:putative heme-binding domain-containing protein